MPQPPPRPTTPEPEATPPDEGLEDVQVISGPILLEIWEQFLYKDGRRYTDEANAEEVILRWSHAASRQAPESKYRIGVDIVEECISHLSSYLCDTPTGSAGMERWLHALLCSCVGLRARRACMRLQTLMRLNLTQTQRMLTELEAAAGGRDCHRKISELLEICCGRLLQNSLVTEAFLPYSFDAKFLARLSLQAFGFTGEELATYPQVLGICFGRVEEPVVLHMYDLSKGMAQNVANVEGVWHTGVVVFDAEYFYNGRVVSDTPNASDFGKANKAMQLGWTLCNKEEFHDYVCDQLSPVFTLNSYDTFANNCNHFSDKVLVFLLSRPLQKEILHQQDQLLEIPGMRMLWPAFRIMIRGLYGDGGTRGSTVGASPKQTATKSGDAIQLSAEDLAMLKFVDIDDITQLAIYAPEQSKTKTKSSGQHAPVVITDAGGLSPGVETSADERDETDIWDEVESQSMASI